MIHRNYDDFLGYEGLDNEQARDEFFDQLQQDDDGRRQLWTFDEAQDFEDDAAK